MKQQNLPDGIGPHEGRELELMLAGKKPLAMFSEVVPSGYSWPDEDFAPYVAAGTLVKEEFMTESPDGSWRVRHLFYALPEETWRIGAAFALSCTQYDVWCDEAVDVRARLGRLLGYCEEDIRAFSLWSRHLQVGDA